MNNNMYYTISKDRLDYIKVTSPYAQKSRFAHIIEITNYNFDVIILQVVNLLFLIDKTRV